MLWPPVRVYFSCHMGTGYLTGVSTAPKTLVPTTEVAPALVESLIGAGYFSFQLGSEFARGKGGENPQASPSGVLRSSCAPVEAHPYSVRLRYKKDPFPWGHS